MPEAQIFDVAVVGAGVFGAWTALCLQQAGRKVVLVDGYGPANSRASSGGESRVIRMGYGTDEIYTRWAMRSLALWQEFFSLTNEHLFHPTGVLWMAHDADVYVSKTLETLRRAGVEVEEWSQAELVERYPQIEFGPVTWAVFEPTSGVLMARRAVQRVVQEAMRNGVSLLPEAVLRQAGAAAKNARLESIVTSGGERIFAGSFVFACGPWLPKLFPELLQELIHPTRQEVFFFGAPAGDKRFAPPQMPVWLDFSEQIYAIPDLEGRGFKVAIDRHGPTCDPDSLDRVVTIDGLTEVREYLARRVPALKDAPLLETRVCQYENTSNGDFLIDRHPSFENVWLVGGGSGHGFKHGPAVGEYVVASMTGDVGPIEPRFTLATKEKVQKRAVF
jgi:monomeric sarcosine oxidase